MPHACALFLPASQNTLVNYARGQKKAARFFRGNSKDLCPRKEIVLSRLKVSASMHALMGGTPTRWLPPPGNVNQ